MVTIFSMATISRNDFLGRAVSTCQLWSHNVINGRDIEPPIQDCAYYAFQPLMLLSIKEVTK